MYTGPKLTNDDLVFGIDTGYGVSDNHVSGRLYKGKPTVNTWNKNTHSYTSGNITATRNATPPVPPPLEVQGFEVYKLQSNDGALNQGIMGTSNVVDGVGGAYVHSVYCYLESGTTVTVGQHWHPWAYGSSQTPPIGEWVRLSETVTNAVDNYGNIANAYRTNGIAYFTAPQYELGSDVSPHVDGTRANTASLIDLTKSTDLTLSAMSYDSTGQPDYDGTDDYINLGDYAPIRLGTNFTIEFVVRPEEDKWMYFFHKGYGSNNSLAWGRHSSGDDWFFSTMIGGSYQNNYMGTATLNKYCHLVATYDGANLRLYENGVLKVTSAKTHDMLTSSASAGIGGPDRYWNGKIPIAKIYSKVLTTEEVVSNFKAYKNRFNI